MNHSYRILEKDNWSLLPDRALLMPIAVDFHRTECRLMHFTAKYLFYWSRTVGLQHLTKTLHPPRPVGHLQNWETSVCIHWNIKKQQCSTCSSRWSISKTQIGSINLKVIFLCVSYYPGFNTHTLLVCRLFRFVTPAVAFHKLNFCLFPNWVSSLLCLNHPMQSPCEGRDNGCLWWVTQAEYQWSVSELSRYSSSLI